MADVELLEILRLKKEMAVSYFLVSYYLLARRWQEMDGYRAKLQGVAEILEKTDAVLERLEVMADQGLVHSFDHDMFRITDIGLDYLSGEIPASEIED